MLTGLVCLVLVASRIHLSKSHESKTMSLLLRSLASHVFSPGAPTVLMAAFTEGDSMKEN